MSNEKSHVVPPKKWKFNRDRHGKDHENNCTEGYIEPKKKNVLNIHHVLCVDVCRDSAMPASFTQEDIDFIRTCLANTVWDINGGGNNIGLPKKWAYVKYPKDDLSRKWGKLPCHQVDHDRYISALKSWMATNVWEKMTGASKAKKCEYLKGENVAELFNIGSSKWKNFLNERGKKNGGPKASLDYCLNGARDNGVNDDNWHISFSMARNGAIRERVMPKSKKLARAHLLDILIK